MRTMLSKRIVIGAMAVATAMLAAAQEPPSQGHPQEHQHPQAQATPTPATPSPTSELGKIKLSQTEWDFGTKWYGEKCEGEVTITNEGKGPLTIVNVKTSCGCTVAKPKSGGVWQNKVLQPGESDVLTLNYNTRKAASKVTQTVTIETNDPTQPSVPFLVKGEVKNLFTMTPGDRITFPRIDKESAESQTIELTSNVPDQKLHLKVKPLDEKARYDVKLETVEEGVKYKLTATTKPPLENGANAIEIMLETGMEQYPEVRIPVTAFVMPRVSVAPPKLFVSSKATAPVQRKVKVTYNPNKPVKITELKAEPATLRVELAPTPAAAVPAIQGVYELNVTLPVAADLPEGKGLITILTDDPSPEYHRLLVEVAVRDVSAAARPTVPAPPPTGATPEGGAPTPPTPPVEPKPSDKPVD